ncbi:uncharacterized protein UBRO_20435 [Ustilago bromivora]|uniref:Uncharacterized protein n=1 Tax=Ustilago bromivora TaxID=307758 RepID=A0A1K0FW76_9BASI|nr:uncharacterized protein UBRO_20435 [Ustilago bromivora]
MDMPSPHDNINNNMLFTALQQASGLAPASEQSSTALQHNTMPAQSNLDGSRQPHPSATSSTSTGAESTQPATSPTSPLSSSTPSGSNTTTSASSLPHQASTCPTQISAACSCQASTHGSSFDNTDRIAYFNWSPSNINHLFDIIYNNDQYQHVLLPRRLTAEQEKGLKTNKDIICGQIWQEMFPDESTVGGAGRVKTNIHWLTEQYNNIKKTILQQTSAGVLLQDMDHNSSNNLVDANVNMDDASNALYPQRCNIPGMESIIEESQYDPIGARVILSFSSSVAATPAAASSSSCSPFSPSSNPSLIGPTPFTITPIDTPTRQHSANTAFGADEVDNGDGGSVFQSPATGTTPKKSRPSPFKNKQEELSEIVWACTQDMLQARIKVEEEHMKREEMHIQFAREESERQECMQTEEHGWLMEMVQMMNPNLPFGNITGSSQSNLDLDPLVHGMDQQDNSDSAHE